MDGQNLELKDIQTILPQKYPFLLIDKIIEFKKNQSLVAIKNITGNEWATNDYAKETDIFPETLIIEAAAQSTLCLATYPSDQKKSGSLVYFIGKVEAEFIDRVRIGDQLVLKVFSAKMLSSGGYADIDAFVEDQLKAKVKLFYSVKQKND